MPCNTRLLSGRQTAFGIFELLPDVDESCGKDAKVDDRFGTNRQQARVNFIGVVGMSCDSLRCMC